MIKKEKGYGILFVDDDIETSDSKKDLLENYGHSVLL